MTRPGWLAQRVRSLAASGAYSAPERPPGALALDSNENLAMPLQFQEGVLEEARGRADVREYPAGGAGRLARAAAEYLRVPHGAVCVGNGSDQLLDLLLSAVAPRRARVVTSDPTFSFFEARCRLHSARLARVPYSDDMTLDLGALEERARGADVIYLDAPNNPTGFQPPRRRLEALVRGFPGLVILDEAYAEFARYTAVPWVRRAGNLVVVRTLSKAFGLAGLRVGYMVACRELAAAFSAAVQHPYPVGTLAVEAGIAALGRAAEAAAVAEGVKRERRRVIDGLRQHESLEAFESDANFVLFDAGGAYRRVHAALAEQGVSVRRIGRVGRRAGCLRVTIGTREMNSRFLLAVRDLLG